MHTKPDLWRRPKFVPCAQESGILQFVSIRSEEWCALMYVHVILRTKQNWKDKCFISLHDAVVHNKLEDNERIQADIV